MGIIETNSLMSRITHAWNIFRGKPEKEALDLRTLDYGASASRPDRVRFRRNTKGTVVASIYNQLANDAAANKIHHVRFDEEGRYLENIESPLNECLTISANIDQTGTQLVRDIVLSMFEEGYVAVVPTHTKTDPTLSNAYDIYAMRVGPITQWYPKHVKVKLYNEENGKKQEIILPKAMVAIVENPLYSTMNEPNSTMQRLIRKINLLDMVDEQSSSGKMDLLIQLPYTIRNQTKQEMANERKRAIEEQLMNSKYGIAYIDSTERVTQLNRPIDNNLAATVDKLTEELYNQLGLTRAVFDGSADEAIMLNYYNRSIAPILDAITEEFRRKFLTKTARTQRQSVYWYNDPFKLVPVASLAEIADKFTRNEIASANEVRSIIGWRPAKDPKADELRNSNIAAEKLNPGGSPNQKKEEPPIEEPNNDD